MGKSHSDVWRCIVHGSSNCGYTFKVVELLLSSFGYPVATYCSTEYSCILGVHYQLNFSHIGSVLSKLVAKFRESRRDNPSPMASDWYRRKKYSTKTVSCGHCPISGRAVKKEEGCWHISYIHSVNMSFWCARKRRSVSCSVLSGLLDGAEAGSPRIIVIIQ